MNVETKRSYLSVLRENALIELSYINSSTQLLDLVEVSSKFFDHAITGESLHQLIVLLSTKNVNKKEVSRKLAEFRQSMSLSEFVVSARSLFLSLNKSDKSFINDLVNAILLVINSYDEGRCVGICTNTNTVHTDKGLSSLDMFLVSHILLSRKDNKFSLPTVCSIDRALILEDFVERDSIGALSALSKLEATKLKQLMYNFTFSFNRVAIATAFRPVLNADELGYEPSMLIPLLVPEEFTPHAGKYMLMPTILTNVIGTSSLANRKYVADNDYTVLDTSGTLHKIKSLKFMELHLEINNKYEHYLKIIYKLNNNIERELAVNMECINSSSTLWIYHTDIIAVLMVLEVLGALKAKSFKNDKVQVLISEIYGDDLITANQQEILIRQVQLVAAIAKNSINSAFKTGEYKQSKKGKKDKKQVDNKKELVKSKLYFKGKTQELVRNELFLSKNK